MIDQRTPTHDCDDMAYPAAAMPDECTCGEADAPDEEERRLARVRIFGEDTP